MITRTISHYNILEVIGEGGMGIVYKARDLNLDRLVALKFLPRALTSDEILTTQFIREARSASLLDHPNICTIHDFEKTDEGEYYIVMAYCQGQTLEQMLADTGPLPLKQFLDIAGQIGQGLKVAHKAGVIHRDLKPANIMIDRNDHVRILDFGLAGMREEINRSSGLRVAGTVAYMSPEQLIGNGLDPRTDLWSFGVVMYRMLSNRLPFDGKQPQSQIYSILKEATAPLVSADKEVPKRLQAIVSKTLQKEADRRYHNAGEIVDGLTALKATLFPGEAKIETKIRHWKRLAITAVLLIIAAVSFLLFNPFSSTIDQKIRIAITPFEIIGHDSQYDYLSQSIAEEIGIRLSRIRSFRVISSNVWQTDASLQKADFSEIIKRLSAKYILDGSLHKMNGQWRVRVHLLAGEDEELIWGDSYDIESSEFSSLEKKIAEQVVSALNIRLSALEQNQIAAAATENATAYYYYLKGRTYSFSNNENAIIYYKRALELDPDFALAYVGLSRSYRDRVLSHNYPLTWYDSSFAMVHRALTLDPECAEAYVRLGCLYMQGMYSMGPDSLPAALTCFQKALSLAPNNEGALIQIGILKSACGFRQEALAYFNRVLEINPLSAAANQQIGWNSYMLGDSMTARKYMHRARELDPVEYDYLYTLYIQDESYEQAITEMKAKLKSYPNHEWLNHDLAVVYKNNGDYNESIRLFKYLTAMRPRQEWHTIGLANAYIEQGLYHEAAVVYEQYEQIQDTCSDCRPALIVYFNHSLLLSRIGQKKQAQQVILQAINNPRIERRLFEPSMWQIIDFYLGMINADSIEQVMEAASQKLQRQDDFISHYFYLGLAYLYNLKPGYRLTPAYKAKAIAHLQKYEVMTLKGNVEFSLARVELKNLDTTTN